MGGERFAVASMSGGALLLLLSQVLFSSIRVLLETSREAGGRALLRNVGNMASQTEQARPNSARCDMQNAATSSRIIEQCRLFSASSVQPADCVEPKTCSHHCSPTRCMQTSRFLGDRQQITFGKEIAANRPAAQFGRAGPSIAQTRTGSDAARPNVTCLSFIVLREGRPHTNSGMIIALSTIILWSHLRCACTGVVRRRAMVPLEFAMSPRALFAHIDLHRTVSCADSVHPSGHKSSASASR